MGKGMISCKNQTIDGATNTSASNHAPKSSATLYEKPLEHQEVAIVGKRWRLNQPLQNSCGAIRNTHSASIINNHSATAHNANNSIPTSDYPLHYQTPLSNYMTSIANDDNSSIAFIDEDPPPYAVHLGASLTPPGPVTEV